MRTVRSAIVVSVMVGAVTLFSTPSVQAEEPGISATGKGITGGALLGGELVMTIEAIAGARGTVPYLLGGLGGAVAGGVGGYFVEQGDDPRPSYYLLAAGMALIIPTTVAVLQATSYKAPEGLVEDKPGKAAPDATPAPAATPEPTPAAPAPAPTPTSQLTRPQHPPIAMSLVDLNSTGLRLGLPMVEVRPMYSSTEVRKYGVEQRTELRIPVFQATF